MPCEEEETACVLHSILQRELKGRPILIDIRHMCLLHTDNNIACMDIREQRKFGSVDVLPQDACPVGRLLDLKELLWKILLRTKDLLRSNDSSLST